MDANLEALFAPQLNCGLPSDWLAFAHDAAISATARLESADEMAVRHLSHSERCYTEIFICFILAGKGAVKYNLDGKQLLLWSWP